MEPIRVLIDTNALPRTVARPSLAIERLVELARKGVVKVLLSDITVNEWRTQREDEAVKAISGAKSALKTALHHGWLKSADHEGTIENALAAMETLSKDIENVACNETNDFLARLKARVLPVIGEDASSVLSNYFKGSPPFKTRKARNDLPDAFIFEAAKRALQEKNGALVTVCNDNALAQALRGLGIGAVYPTLDEFLQMEELKQLEKLSEVEKQWPAKFDRVVALLKPVEPAIVKRVIQLLDNALSSHSVWASEIPGRRADIGWTDDISNAELNWEDATDYGSGRVAIPFMCDCNARIYFDIPKSELFDAPAWVQPATDSYSDEPDISCEGTVKLFVSLTIAVRYSEAQLIAKDFENPTDISIESVDDLTVASFDP